MNLNKFYQREAITKGKPLPTLLFFAIPIILGNIFQQLYSIVDAAVVGQYLGDLALAAISVSSPIVDVVNALLIGSSIGVGVLMARLYGAKEYNRLRTVHSTILIGGVLVTLTLTLSGIVASGHVLQLQGTDKAVCAEAEQYLKIIFIGLIFNFLYLYYAALLRSCGNSRTPFIIILLSSVLHAGLDLLLVCVWEFGLYGAAISTIFSQMVSALWCMIYTHKHYRWISLSRRELRFSRAEAKMIIGYAWAAALQQGVAYLGRLLTQGMLNSWGTAIITGYHMGMRVEAFAFCFSQGISAAMVVCLSQNLGSKDYRRVHLFFRRGLAVEAVLAVLIGVIYYSFAEQLISMFSDSRAVIAAGVSYTKTMAALYSFSVIGEVLQGFFRGLGRLKLTMIASMSQIITRVTIAYYTVPLWGVKGICISVVTGWILMVFAEGVYSIYVTRKLPKLANGDIRQ